MQPRPPDRSFRFSAGMEPGSPSWPSSPMLEQGFSKQGSPQAASASPENRCEMQVMPPPPRSSRIGHQLRVPSLLETLMPGHAGERLLHLGEALRVSSLPAQGPRCAEGTAQALVERVLLR